MSRRQQRLCLVILAWIWLLPRLSFADPFTDHIEHARRLYDDREYSAALDEYRAAYKLRQLPNILINMGRCNHRLGHAREALTLYQRYLTIEQNPEPKIKSDLETYIRQTKAMIAAAEEPEPAPASQPATRDAPAMPAPKATAQDAHPQPPPAPLPVVSSKSVEISALKSDVASRTPGSPPRATTPPGQATPQPMKPLLVSRTPDPPRKISVENSVAHANEAPRNLRPSSQTKGETPAPPVISIVAGEGRERAPQHIAGVLYGGIGGAVLGLGFVGLGGSSLALDGRCVNDIDPCERLYTGRVAGTAELISGGILLGTGIGLIALGVTWQRKAQRRGTAQTPPRDPIRARLSLPYTPLLATRMP